MNLKVTYGSGLAIGSSIQHGEIVHCSELTSDGQVRPLAYDGHWRWLRAKSDGALMALGSCLGISACSRGAGSTNVVKGRLPRQDFANFHVGVWKLGEYTVDEFLEDAEESLIQVDLLTWQNTFTTPLCHQ